MDTISVIVPCHNRVEYLPRCLNSILCQSYENLEIVCVNDGSTDNSLNVLKKYAIKDARIKILDIPHGGPGKARNLGIENSSGNYLMFCDSDDEFVPEACEKLHHALTNDNCDIAMCSTKVIYGSDIHMQQSDQAYYNLKYDGLISNAHDIINVVDVSVCNKIFRRSLIDEYAIKFIENRLYEDACFAWKYFSVSKRFFCVKDQLYIYYRHFGSIMNETFSKSKRSIDHIYIADDIYEFLIRHHLFENFAQDFLSFYKSCVNFALNYSDEESKVEIEALNAQFQKKYAPWLTYFEKKEMLKNRQILLNNLRSNIKL